MKKTDTPIAEGHRAFIEAREARITVLRQALNELIPDPEAVVLEIGCGHGHYLTAYAEQAPGKTCIGIDLVTKRIEKACQKRDKRQLERLHFLKADVREFLAAWPAHLRMERVFILFPDPWPKKRHIKNRILQPGLLDAVAKNAHGETRLHFRTDHKDHYVYGFELIEAHPRWKILPEEAWPFENSSFFQDLFDGYQSLTARHVE